MNQPQSSASRAFDEAASEPSAREERQAVQLRPPKGLGVEVTVENLERKSLQDIPTRLPTTPTDQVADVLPDR